MNKKMKYLGEVEAENLLEKEGFQVVNRSFCDKKSKISSCLFKCGLPCVMKVSGKKIVHKKKLGGIRLNVSTYSQALSEYKALKKIKGADGVMFQSNVNFTKEFLVGVKKTPEFGHVIVFGSGGSDVEQKKDVAFRVCPLTHEDCLDLIHDVDISKNMGARESERVAKVIMMISEFCSKYPDVLEMDINPFVMSGAGPLVLDARILFG
jgi:acetyltransferase